MLTKTVKISNVTNLSDARYCAGMGVEMLGFSIDEDSPNYISPKNSRISVPGWLA
jgi:phosphoribosylanthranilate isomerase